MTEDEISVEHLQLGEDNAIRTAVQAIKLLIHATP